MVWCSEVWCGVEESSALFSVMIAINTIILYYHITTLQYFLITLLPSTHTGPRMRGRLVVIGSVEIFGDDWLDKEENSKLCDVLFSWLLNETELDMTSDRQVREKEYWLLMLL